MTEEGKREHNDNNARATVQMAMELLGRCHEDRDRYRDALVRSDIILGESSRSNYELIVKMEAVQKIIKASLE